MIFEIGSISKVFTGLLLAQAVIEKKLTLDMTLRKLMGPTQTFADNKVAGITLLQLATHTSGLPRVPDEVLAAADPADPYARYDRTQLNATMARVKLAHAAPFPLSYSNLGVGLLGDLLSRLYGKPWEELVQERITKPLRMKDTGVALNAEQQKRLVPPYAGAEAAKPWHFSALAGAGALRSTAADMLVFGRALARPDGSPLKEAIRLMEQPRMDGTSGLCLGIMNIEGRPGYWFQGGTGGFTSWISARTADAHVVSILINNSALLPETMLSGKAPAAAPSLAPTPADATPADYAGVYDTGVDSPRGHIYYTFEERGQELWHEITGQPFRLLTRHPTTPDRFELKSFKAEIQFTRENGNVVSTTLFQNGHEIPAQKVAKP
jgi:CubicO group peptidase (beta-lactamase class C family)